MTFEGQQMQGSAKIMEKINSLTFQKIQHLITAVDCQPTFDGGILINVLGQLKVRKGIYLTDKSMGMLTYIEIGIKCNTGLTSISQS